MKTRFKILYLFLIFFALAVISSCNSQKALQKKQAEAERVVLGNFERFRDLCEVSFPPQPVKFVKGDERIVYDTFYKEGVVLECPPSTLDNPAPKVKCPESKVIYRNLERTDTLVVPDLLKESKYISEIQSLKKDVSYWKNTEEETSLKLKEADNNIHELKQKLTKKNYQFYILLSVVGLLILYRIFGRSLF